VPHHQKTESLPKNLYRLSSALFLEMDAAGFQPYPQHCNNLQQVIHHRIFSAILFKLHTLGQLLNFAFTIVSPEQ
jgi:hypothetical protein